MHGHKSPKLVLLEIETTTGCEHSTLAEYEDIPTEAPDNTTDTTELTSRSTESTTDSTTEITADSTTQITTDINTQITTESTSGMAESITADNTK